MPSNPIRILHLSYEYSLWDSDLTHAITSALTKGAFSVTTAYLQGNQPPLLSQQKNCVYHFFNFSAKSLKGLRWKSLLTIIEFCKKQQFDVVLTHHFKPCYLIAFAALAIKFKKKISVFHGCGEFNRFYRKLIARFFMHSFQIVTVSEAVKKDLLHAKCGFRSEQIRVIHNAIDAKKIQSTQLSRNEARKILGIPLQQFIFGQVGRLVPSKGQSYLLHAFHQCQAPNAHLVIIGGGRSQAHLLKEIYRLNLQHRVHLLGEIPNAYRYFTAFDVFISSSLKEGFGIVLLEAMAAHVPIIATNIEGIPEVVDGLAPLYPAKNSHALAKLMQEFYQLESNILRQQGEKLNQRLHQSFDITHYEHAFQKLCLIEKEENA